MPEYLIINGLIITMDKKRRIFTNGAIAIEGNKIVSIGKSKNLLNQFKTHQIIDANKGIVIPGLVNSHSHLFAMYSRGLGADGQRKIATKSNYSWDIDRLVLYDKETCKISADLAILEMIKSGITTTQDSHYINFHSNSIYGIAEAVKESGIRAVLGRGCWDAPGLAPSKLTEDIKTAINSSEKFIRDWCGQAEGRIQTRVEASMLAQCTDEMLQATKTLAQKKDVGWATHLQYKLASSKIDPRSNDVSLDRFKGRAVEYMDHLDLLGPGSLLIHCTYIDNAEIKLLAKTDTPVAHCPLANAYGGNSTVTRIPLMNNCGVTVGLGTDSVATNDSLDLFQVMKFGSLLHKVNSGSSSVLTAEKVLEMSTIESAKALQLNEKVGSIEVGKLADLVIFNSKCPGFLPSMNPIKNLVYSTGNNRPPRTVMIDGKIVYHAGEFTSIDESHIYTRVEEKCRELFTQLDRLDEFNMFRTSPWPIS